VQSKRRVNAFSKFIILVVIVYLATYMSLYGLRFVLGTEYPIVVVEGVSMEPTYYDGDLAILRGIPKEDIKIEDVVVYQRSIYSIRIIHRVINKYTKEGELYLVTKGDNNNNPDPPIPAETVIGVVVLHIPAIGKVVLALQSPIGLVISGALIIIILLLEVFDEDDNRPKTGNAL